MTHKPHHSAPQGRNTPATGVDLAAAQRPSVGPRMKSEQHEGMAMKITIEINSEIDAATAAEREANAAACDDYADLLASNGRKAAARAVRYMAMAIRARGGK